MVTPPLIDEMLRTLIQMAVREDMGPVGEFARGDKTVEMAIDPGERGEALVVCRKPGVVAGLFLIPAILAEYDAGLVGEILHPDGTVIQGPTPVARIRGPVGSMLSAERVVLNFASRLSGVATLTHKYVEAIAHVKNRPVICDTRKTTPGYRVLEKYAVRCGGGVNDRMALYDGVMLKDNHLAAIAEKMRKENPGVGALALGQLTVRIRRDLDPRIPLWLEVDTIEQLAAGLITGGQLGADIILVDNFTPHQLRIAVAMRDAANRDRKPLLEASGGITLDNLVEVAETGIDRMAIGALTHSAPILDLAMDYVEVAGGSR